MSLLVYMCNDRGSLNIYISTYFLCRGGLTYLIPYVRHTQTHTCLSSSKRERMLNLAALTCSSHGYISIGFDDNKLRVIHTYTFVCVYVCVCVHYSHMSCRSKGGHFDGDIAHTC